MWCILQDLNSSDWTLIIRKNAQHFSRTIVAPHFQWKHWPHPPNSKLHLFLYLTMWPLSASLLKTGQCVLWKENHCNCSRLVQFLSQRTDNIHYTCIYQTLLVKESLHSIFQCKRLELWVWVMMYDLIHYHHYWLLLLSAITTILYFTLLYSYSNLYSSMYHHFLIH